MIASTDLTICQRNTSRWSIKLISDSSLPSLFALFKKDKIPNKTAILEKAKIIKKGTRHGAQGTSFLDLVFWAKIKKKGQGTGHEAQGTANVKN